MTMSDSVFIPIGFWVKLRDCDMPVNPVLQRQLSKLIPTRGFKGINDIYLHPFLSVSFCLGGHFWYRMGLLVH